MVATAIQTTTAPAARHRLSETEKREWLVCAESPLYFIHHYVFIYDAIALDWIPFRLWPAQARTLKVFFMYLLVVVLKARQIGMTWLALGFALWLMLFHPAATVLLFSKRDDEAIDLLDFRLKGMYQRLPPWMQARAVVSDSKHEWVLSNGSRAKALPTTAGDSYTATLVICDEFDLIADQDRIMRSVKPTIDNGGRMILLSRPDKSRPMTRFKAIYRAAKAKLNEWADVFLPWYVHPGRDQAWYEAQKNDIQTATGSTDDLFEQYPETDAQALAARTLDKRIPPAWLDRCYEEMQPVFVIGSEADESAPKGVPPIPGLHIFRRPEPGRVYVIGVDPAEGLASSDDSALTVGDALTGEEVASLAGKFEPKIVFPGQIAQVAAYYNGASVLVERNNHGHAVIGWLLTNTPQVSLLQGLDGGIGWLNSPAGKVLLYDTTAAAFMHRTTLCHSFATQDQLGSIEKDTLRAPEGLPDDLAVSYALMIQAQSLGAYDWGATA